MMYRKRAAGSVREVEKLSAIVLPSPTIEFQINCSFHEFAPILILTDPLCDDNN